ncbi:hypothetical protein [Wenxinia saemankumensis]|uniref:Uncharacterized protein n=1 Tax=Wenxinia saemankumensis TaxID=1447782 RepID=A0A1M6EN91_9RHOB|nr:hypothetical protein [Wenxinia saemankumensis]SHI86962.1 hypothetical protein SAMN05444417_2087 [Wenxinia saemankumensis]
MTSRDFQQRWRERREADARIAQLGLGGLDEGDYAPSTLDRLARMPEEHVVRMHWMADLFGVGERLEGDADFQRDVGAACANCGRTGDCHRAFADPAGLTRAAAAEFCPNVPAYRRAARD